MHRRTWMALALAAMAGPTIAPAQDAPVPAKDAAARMTVPPGFKVTLFAGEPELVQPIAMTTDDRGRLWVVENLSYPGWKGKPEDRVSIFEDKDNDGQFDKKTVFWDKGQNLSGIALGYGGVWLCSIPNLIFVPDRDGDDRPDGPPVILLDGWNVDKAQHNVVNSPTWGPDGWLYGCNGIQSNSRVGKPGTPDADRVPINCGVWRYHPVKKTFEAVFHGTTNPFGLDFDEYGQIFITNCVIKHAWHAIPGANVQRMYGQPFNPHLYGLIESPADHIHWGASESWNDIRSLGVTPTTDRAGGGHAHSGAMIYLGDNFPPEYRGSLFVGNIHGNRVNRDKIERKGSGYVIKHADDFLVSHDPWFRPIALHMGPDGGVYVADWSDTGECHDFEDIHRENGRIYKVIYGTPKPLVLTSTTRDVPSLPESARPQATGPGPGSTTPSSVRASGQPPRPFHFSQDADEALIGKPLDLPSLSDRGLFELQGIGDNQWLVRHARRLAFERGTTRHPDLDAKHYFDPMALAKTFGSTSSGNQDDRNDLSLFWSWASFSALNEPTLVVMLGYSGKDWLRASAVRLLADDRNVSPAVLSKFATLAKSDTSPVVRLALASALQRLPVADRWEVAAGLASHAEDATDQNLPLMIWSGIEPLVSADPDRALALAATAKIPLIRQNIARRFASLAE